MKRIIIHHIGLSKTSPFLSGGEKAELEIIEFLGNHQRTDNYIYTSESGETLYKQLKRLPPNSFIRIGSIKWEKISLIFAYYLRILECPLRLRKFPNSAINIIFSHEEFLPTILYSFLEKLLNPSSKWIFFYHMKAPSLFRGFKGEFTNTLHIPSLRLIRYIVEQQIAFLLTKSVDVVITVNEYYRSFLEEKYPQNKVYVLKSYGGVSVPDIKVAKQYDAVWMGRFHTQKGILELIDIVERVVSVKRNFRVVVLGGGNKRIERKILKLVRAKNLDSNIFFKGFITGDEKYRILKMAKVFLMTSYFESFGQVIIEAMKCGLPTIAYSLPTFSFLGDTIIKVSILDNLAFAERIIDLIISDDYYFQVQKKVLAASQGYSWAKTGKEISNLIEKLSRC